MISFSFLFFYGWFSDSTSPAVSIRFSFVAIIMDGSLGNFNLFPVDVNASLQSPRRLPFKSPTFGK